MTSKENHSFMILAYKESPYIDECIKSLQKQTVRSEICLCSSNSSEFLMRISKKYQIPLFISSVGGDIADDWSFAYRICNTRYVTLAHQDDIYLPEYTELCLKAIGENGLIAFTDYAELMDNGKIRSQTFALLLKRLVLSPFLIKSTINSILLKKILLCFGDPISCPSVMYDKGRIGDFKFAHGISCGLDWEAWIRLSIRKGGFTYIYKKLMLHRIYKQSQSFLLTNNRRRKNEEEVLLASMWPKPIARILAHIHYLISTYGQRGINT